MGRQTAIGVRRTGCVRRRPTHDARRATHDAIHASGVTLAEVVVAAGLLLIAIVPMLRALTVAQVTDRTIARKTRSLMLAQRELERIKAKSIYGYDGHFAQASRVLEGTFLCTVTDDADADLRKIAVSVGSDRNEDNILSPDETEVRLCTYLARRWPGP